MDELRKAHDELLKNKPETAVHDETDCIFCNEDYSSEEGGDMKTFTEEELNAAVAAAVAPIQAELETAKEAQADKDVDDRVSEVKAEADQAVADIQGQLDEAMVQKGAAEKALEDTKAYLESVRADEEAAAAHAAALESRKAAVAELALFGDEYVETNIERWAALADEDFDALMADWKTVAESAKSNSSEGAEEESSDTAMNSTRDTASSRNTSDDFNDVLGARSAGVDIHTIH